MPEILEMITEGTTPTKVQGTDQGQVTGTETGLKTAAEEESHGRDQGRSTESDRGTERETDHVIGTGRDVGAGHETEIETTGDTKMIEEEADREKENPRSIVGDPPQVTESLTMFCT